MSTSLLTEIGVKWLKIRRLPVEMSMKETGVEILDLIPSILSVKKTKSLECTSLDEFKPLDRLKRRSAILKSSGTCLIAVIKSEKYVALAFLTSLYDVNTVSSSVQSALGVFFHRQSTRLHCL